MRQSPSSGVPAAIARYDQLMAHAEPHQIERMHRDAFGALTPLERARIANRMTSELSPQDRPASPSVEDLARAARWVETRRVDRMRGLLTRIDAGAVTAPRADAPGGLLSAVACAVAASPAAVAILDGCDEPPATEDVGGPA